MLIWPAVDLLDGRCVRLYQGRYDEVTEFSRDPVEVAAVFVEEGARALHVVDLDGAREGAPQNAGVVREIRRRVDVPLQVGGGLRSGDDVARYLDSGVDRVILGTGAARRPDWVAGLVERHGTDAVAAGVDVREGEVVVEGWTEGSGTSREELLDRLADAGVETVVYTDTVRDGTLTRPDVDGARQVVDRGFRTLVAGGISRVEDVRALRDAGAAGAVIGSALYHGSLTLADARAAAGEIPGEDAGNGAGDGPGGPSEGDGRAAGRTGGGGGP